MYNTNFVPRDSIIDTVPLQFTGAVDLANDLPPFLMDEFSILDLLLPMY